MSDDILRKIRGLLAKAEDPNCTTHEAEALSAKAEELIIKHAIDTALLDAKAEHKGTPEVRTYTIERPYPLPKIMLFNAVAKHNRCKLIRTQSEQVKVVGFPADLDTVEMLYTSLLVQATHAMVRASRGGSTAGGTRSFRAAFMKGYAGTVGNRLAEIAARVTREATSGSAGTALVLRDRGNEVDKAYSDAFPRTRSTRVSAGDRAGYAAGGRAGAAANLGQPGMGHRHAVGA